MAKQVKWDDPGAVCPKCRGDFALPKKRHPMEVRIVCPHCKTSLSVTLGVAGAQMARWALKQERKLPCA